MVRDYLRKLIMITVWYLIYYNLCFLIFAPIIFTDPVYFTILVLYYLVTFADTLIRPTADPEELKDKYTIVMVLTFVLNPFLMILAIVENQELIVNYFPLWDDLIISYVGILIYIIGGGIILLSRVQLGRLGSGAISHLQDEHKLYTGGMYRYVRHPLYTGGLIGAIGMNMAFRSIIMPLLIFILYFTIFKHRIEQEERLLREEFGEEYLEYSKRTKRLFPPIY